MNKTEFLEKLKSCLAVLEEKEQQDILEEYTQHIDMKTESGLSEEEAIRDFGDLDQLAAEILEAYHVNPDYSRNRSVPRISGKGRGVKKGLDACLVFFKKIGQMIHRGASSAGRMMRAFPGSVRSFFARCLDHTSPALRRFRPGLSREEVLEPGYGDDPADAPAKTACQDTAASPLYRGTKHSALSRSRKKGMKGLRQTAARLFCGIGAFFSGCISLAVWCFFFCLRWIWNICLVIMALLSGSLTLISLYLLAVFLVWLLQGYPSVGITLISLGGVLCGVSFTILCISLLKVRRKTEKAELPPEDSREITEEVQHA